MAGANRALDHTRRGKARLRTVMSGLARRTRPALETTSFS